MAGARPAKLPLKMPYFKQVVDGTKTVDLRLDFPSYSKLKYIGIRIEFYDPASNSRIIKRLNSWEVRMCALLITYIYSLNYFQTWSFFVHTLAAPATQPNRAAAAMHHIYILMHHNIFISYLFAKVLLFRRGNLFIFSHSRCTSHATHNRAAIHQLRNPHSRCNAPAKPRSPRSRCNSHAAHTLTNAHTLAAPATQPTIAL